jgi:D-glycero-D-manno-heptose 1,7-bisphosphate phosphatase
LVHKAHKAVFLDRDGVINVDKGYVCRPEDLELIDGAAQGIRILRKHGFHIIVVTNQSGIARGLYTEQDVKKLHAHLQTLLAKQGARIDAFYYCPHHPEALVEQYRRICDCRKPKPGLLLRAIADFNLNANLCYMVGNEFRDVEAGWRAGCRQCFLITQGSILQDSHSNCQFRLVRNLLEAARQIIREVQHGDPKAHSRSSESI